MKKIFLIVTVAALSLTGCTRNSREAEVRDDEPTGSYGAAGSDSADNLNEADTTRNDGYKADSITQTYPIPR